MPPFSAGQARGPAVDVRRDQDEYPGGPQDGLGLPYRFERKGRMLDEIDHRHGGVAILRKSGCLQRSLDEPDPIPVCRGSHCPGAGLDAGRLPAAASGEVEQDAGSGADIEKSAPLRDELFETPQDAEEIPGAARGLLFVEGIFDAAVKRGQVFRSRAGVGEDVSAVATDTEVPGLAVLAVGDLDLVLGQVAGKVPLFIPADARARAGRTGRQSPEPCLPLPHLSGRAGA